MCVCMSVCLCVSVSVLCVLYCVCVCVCVSVLRHIVPLLCLVVVVGLDSDTPLVEVCFIILTTCDVPTLPLGALEFFAGEKAVTNAHLSNGVSAVGYDIRYDPVHMDFMSEVGYVNALRLALSCDDLAQNSNGPVCSSFVWVSRASTGRSVWNPLGNARCASAVMGNEMVSRLMLILLIMKAKGCFVITEQPKESLMESHPRFVWFNKRVPMFRKYVAMKWYGAPSLKGTWLYSWHKDVLNTIDAADYLRPNTEQSVKLVTESIDASGRRRVHGGKTLKSSQAYPPAYGAAVAAIHQKHKASLRASHSDFCSKVDAANVDLSDLFHTPAPHQQWKDAGLDRIKRHLLS
jgi:hypothetical protein